MCYNLFMPPKKPEKKEAKPVPPKSDPFAEVVGRLMVVFLAIYLLNGFVGMFVSNGFLSRGWQGLTPQGIILSHTEAVGSSSDPVGAQVISTGASGIPVYDSPGGKIIGSQPFDSAGKILRGYVEVGGDKYWYVDFQNGKDGWVKESDIAVVTGQPSPVEKIILWFWSALSYLKLISVIFSLALILLIAYIVFHLTELRKNQHTLLYPAAPVADLPDINPKWTKILAQVESQNENDWKLAIIEADIMLADILDKLSLPGETMGDKMKAVEKSDFTTIDNAWEAHKIRNQVAHEGSDFVLNQREARRVVALYQTVFEEFQVI